MILPVLQNIKYRLLLSHLCLTVSLSSTFAPSLVASHNDPLIENEKKSLKRTRSDSNENNNNNREVERSLEVGCPSKRQKNETSSALSTDIFVYDDSSESLSIPNEITTHFFMSISFKDIRAGRCVSKAWNQLLMRDDFCTYYGQHFSPSTARAMKMTPQEFIHYWSTPSFTVLDNFVMIDGLLQMSADGSTITDYIITKSNNDNEILAYHWVSGKTVRLPSLNNGIEGSTYGISVDGSIIVGQAHDGANGATYTAVKWINGEIVPLPLLNNGDDSAAIDISADGSIIVGHAHDGVNNKSTAVKWINGEIVPLPFLNNEDASAAIGISADGSIIVGYAHDGVNNKRTAVKWDNGEVFSIQALLESEGLNLEEIHLDDAREVSANGLQVIGESILDGRDCYFKAILPSKYSQ